MPPPNILIFMTDQQRADTAPPFGRALMPNLARFARQAVTFSQAYCPSPHCCPSRATFFSGLYPSEHGVWNNVDVGNTLSRGLFPGTRLFSQDLADAGYELHYSGKWHVSAVQSPAEFGWRMGWPAPHRLSPVTDRPDTHEWPDYEQMAGQPEPSQRGPGQILRPGYGPYTHYGQVDEIWPHDRQTVDDAVAAIRHRRRGAGPWCQFVGTIGPHDPYTVPRRFLELYNLDDLALPPSFGDAMADKPGLYRRTRGRFDQLTEPEQRDALRHYLAHCSVQDELFGRVLAALDERGELDDTLIVFTSDHGDYAGDHGLWCKGLPCFRGAYHVPAIVRPPGGADGRVVDHFVSLADFAPTFLDVAGLSPERPLAGVSLRPWLGGETPPDWRQAIFTQTNGNELYGIQRSVTTRDWKYVYNGFDQDELYDRRRDPHELINLTTDPAQAEVVRQMCRRLWRFAHERRDVCINGYIMVALAPWGPAVGGKVTAPDGEAPDCPPEG
jgi:arylsulfatase A-like enzyme